MSMKSRALKKAVEAMAERIETLESKLLKERIERRIWRRRAFSLGYMPEPRRDGADCGESSRA